MTPIQKTFNDFKSALDRLDEALSRKSDDELIQAGCIQYFEFTFELAWKLIRLINSEEGLSDLDTPFDCIKIAYKRKWIDHEKPWLAMLNSRNKMSHTYSSEKAGIIYDQLPEFLKELRHLFQSITEHLSKRTSGDLEAGQSVTMG